MDRAGPACRGYQVTTTRQHEQPGPQSLHLWAPNTLSSSAGPTTGPRTPGGSARSGGGAGAIQWPPLGPTRPRSHPVHKQHGRVPEEAPVPQGALLLLTPSHGPRPGTTAPPLGPKGGQGGLFRVPDQSPGGTHRWPACPLTSPPLGCPYLQRGSSGRTGTSPWGRPRVRTPPLPRSPLHAARPHQRSARPRRPRPTWLQTKSSTGRLRKSTRCSKVSQRRLGPSPATYEASLVPCPLRWCRISRVRHGAPSARIRHDQRLGHAPLRQIL
ncbi:hypothetical protein NDU88_003227 [Pleurodeles waltl]|uniref:Uncharacterized protein n=1 Tax=Pleurodeles waltl TaxID=8319 RepID=A0AAV7WUR4_PLEWA|nr:hypothetical protein NDU88_003227 [Pleurodeles waltl]